MTAMTATTGALVTVWRLLREATGESRWDDYLARCEATGEQPMSRRGFERHRSDAREGSPRGRCC
jgi:uncharacterized short protein YbdD (DUF466 family)